MQLQPPISDLIANARQATSTKPVFAELDPWLNFGWCLVTSVE